MSKPTAPITDEQLVAGCLQGGRSFQEALYKRFASKMFGVVLRYAPDRDTAADLLQEGFITVFQRLGQYRAEGPLEGWVRRVMVNTALNHCRKQMRQGPTLEIETAFTLTDGTDALDGLAAADLLQLVQELPVGFRTVFNLYAIEGYSHQEIADALGISVGTSKSQLARAREALKKRLVSTPTPKIHEPLRAFG